MASWSSSAVAPPRADATPPVAGPSFEALRYDVSERIATITLDRPEALNSLTVPLKGELLTALKAAARDPEVRAVVLTGSGRAFCAGQDLRERLEPDAAPLAVEVRQRYNPIVRAMIELDKPIVGAINGVAAGAGASLAFACDIRIAAEGASFVLGFGRVGLVPDSGATWFLPRLIGASKATELALTHEPLSAADAERFGLVAKVVPAEGLTASSREVAARLAAGAPRAIALTKRALRRALETSLDETLEFEADLQGVAGRTRDHAEGVAAFIEKRPPRFEGE
jgi:2-(1,2-epoxy-1,2-dihydrophenyl)acetyl-CoA isomerase